MIPAPTYRCVSGLAFRVFDVVDWRLATGEYTSGHTAPMQEVPRGCLLWAAGHRVRHGVGFVNQRNVEQSGENMVYTSASEIV